VLERGLQRLQERGEFLVGLIDGQQLHLATVLVQVVAEDKSMVAFFLGLDLVPVGKALETLLLVVVGEGQIQIRRVQLLVDLIVQQFVHACVHEHLLLGSYGGVNRLGTPFHLRI